MHAIDHVSCANDNIIRHCHMRPSSPANPQEMQFYMEEDQA